MSDSVIPASDSNGTGISNNTGSFPAAFARLERLQSDPSASNGKPLPQWAVRLRDPAQKHFLKVGLPSRTDEEWRYTSVKAISAEKYVVAQEDSASSLLNDDMVRFHIPDASAHELVLVFIDGVLATGRSQLSTLPPGLRVMTLAEACEQRPDVVKGMMGCPEGFGANPFSALNQAFFGTGAYIEVDRGHAVKPVLNLVYLTSAGDGRPRPLATFPRNLIVVGEQGELRLVETYAGEGEYFSNPATDIRVATGGRLMHVRMQAESAKAQHVGLTRVDVGRDSYYESFHFSIGAKMCRSDVDVTLSGEGANVLLDGLYMACGQQHVDHHTSIDHKVPHATSSQHYKGILDENARGVFNGKVFVRQNAQKTVALQMNRNLLLSTDAEIDTKPELQIDADDVKCTHGAAIGRLDAMEIFYLMSRGIPSTQAEAILCQAFADEVMMKVTIPGAKRQLKAMVAGYFNL